MRGKFICIEGIGGTGKTTLLNSLKEYLGDGFLFTREPNDPGIRNLLLTPRTPHFPPFSELALFYADRCHQRTRVVLPALETGKHVIQDRGSGSSWAYQIIGAENLELSNVFSEMEKVIPIHPDLYLVLDVPVDIMLARIKRDQRIEKDQFDERERSFQERARQGFLDWAQNHSSLVIDATQTPEKVFEIALGAIYELTK
jgi:dTMP kinase